MSAQLEWQETNEVPMLVGRAVDVPGVRVAFTCRLGGVSAAPFDSLNLSSFVGDDERHVTANRERALGAAGLDGAPIALVKQIHGDRILDADGRSGVLGEGDGVAVSRGGGVACVMSADCVPVLLVGPDEVVAVHAGWKGLAGGVIDRAVEKIGTVVAAWIGPSIKGCCYEVGADVLDAFQAAGLPTLPGAVDPGDAAAEILTRAGVDGFAQATECTSCDARFFSHRRDGATGRQGGLIAWT